MSSTGKRRAAIALAGLMAGVFGISCNWARAEDQAKLRIVVFGAHPDHRYVGVLVQDSAYMVTVPKFCPETLHPHAGLDLQPSARAHGRAQSRRDGAARVKKHRRAGHRSALRVIHNSLALV